MLFFQNHNFSWPKDFERNECPDRVFFIENTAYVISTFSEIPSSHKVGSQVTRLHISGEIGKSEEHICIQIYLYNKGYRKYKDFKFAHNLIEYFSTFHETKLHNFKLLDYADRIFSKIHKKYLLFFIKFSKEKRRTIPKKIIFKLLNRVDNANVDD